MHKHGPLHANIAMQQLSITEAHRTSITLDDDSEPEFCDACAQAKPHHQSFPEQAQNRAQNFRDRIHADLWGPAKVESIFRSRYTVDFIDCATRWTHVAFLHCKNEVFRAYLDFEKRLEMQDGVKIKILQSDPGREFRPQHAQAIRHC
jgi:hypothetical protein